MAQSTNSLNIDGMELFTDCLAQATLIVKQVLPSHFTNATPDAEWDVRDLTGHMLVMLESVPNVIAGIKTEIADDVFEEAEIDSQVIDLSGLWQSAADRAETAIAEVDLEDTVWRNGDQTAVEDFLMEIAGDLLIHAWDLGEAIGMPVRFQPNVAEAVMETTIVPNNLMLASHNLFSEPIDPPANADLQARLLALFGRSHAWRTASA